MNKHLVVWLTVAAGFIFSNAYAASGEQWEVTTKTEMPGMPAGMGDTTMTVCLVKGAEKDPRQMMQQDSDCKVTDMKTAGNKTTWKMRCDKNGEVMTGTGEVTHKSSSYQGVTKLSGKSDSQTINMTASFSGKRIGTACDSSAAPVATVKGMENMNDMMGMAKSQMASAMAEQCEVSNYQAAELISSRFFGDNAACPGKEKFACKVISKDVKRNTEVYVKLAKHDDTSDVAIAKTCGIDMAAATKAICAKVDGSNYEELADYCPSEAKAFEAQRSYSSTPRSADVITDNPVGNTIDNVQKLKSLKGMFGF
ncbi:MAG: DUF3617 family protein [Sideroxydans sp.]|nr:DUF3617 family protein [Sideroxydans sp.]